MIFKLKTSLLALNRKTLAMYLIIFTAVLLNFQFSFCSVDVCLSSEELTVDSHRAEERTNRQSEDKKTNFYSNDQTKNQRKKNTV